MCTGHDNNSKSEKLLKNAGFSDEEQAVLHIVRRYCAAYSRAGSPCWEDAIDVATAVFGDINGPVVAVSALNVLRSIRPCRKSAFTFSNPYCQCCAKRMTECERLLLQTLQCIRKQDQSAAAVDAILLCQGEDTASFIEQVETLSRALGPAVLSHSVDHAVSLQRHH